jgi:hypothetical protein
MNCTLFAISPSELDATAMGSLPGYDEASASVASFAAQGAPLELGARWSVLHVALGNHTAPHPLGFLDSGGEPRPEFAGAATSGRYFDPAATVQILAALAQIPQPARELERLRIFIAGIVAKTRGLIVYHFR